MGCGFGTCMGCSRPTVSGMKRVCKDGPVFRKEELLWDA
jgi:dihydroorotate dehydrogenase electron transfer subunit